MFEMFENKIKIQKFDIYSFVIILITFVSDRLSKIYAIKLIESQGREIFLFDFLNITLNWNTGIGFGLLSLDGTIFYHLISGLILMIIIYLIYLMVLSDNFGKIIFSIIIGGATGNLYDRLTYFAVPDFIDFHVDNFHWFTFNVADIFISVGIFVMIIKELVLKNEKK